MDYDDYGYGNGDDDYGINDGDWGHFDVFDPREDDQNAFEALNSSKRLDLWNNIIACRGRLSNMIFDKYFDEQEIIIFIETILKNIQRFSKTNNMKTTENSQPMSPGRSIGFLYRFIFPKLKGPKKSINRMYKLALETATFVLKIESNERNYAINNPHSLRSAFNYLKEITPNPVEAGVSTILIIGPEVVYGQAQTKERLERVEGVIDSKVADLVKSLQNFDNKMMGGFGPGKDVKLPEEWVREYIEDDTDEETDEEEEENTSEKRGLKLKLEEEDDDEESADENDYWNAG